MAAKRAPSSRPATNKPAPRVTVNKQGNAVLRYKGGAASTLGAVNQTSESGVREQLVALGRGDNGIQQFGYVPTGLAGEAGSHQGPGGTPYALENMKTAGRVTEQGWKAAGPARKYEGMLQKAVGERGLDYNAVASKGTRSARGDKRKTGGNRTGGGYTDVGGLPVDTGEYQTVSAGGAEYSPVYAEADITRTGYGATQGKGYGKGQGSSAQGQTGGGTLLGGPAVTTAPEVGSATSNRQKGASKKTKHKVAAAKKKGNFKRAQSIRAHARKK